MSSFLWTGHLPDRGELLKLDFPPTRTDIRDVPNIPRRHWSVRGLVLWIVGPLPPGTAHLEIVGDGEPLACPSASLRRAAKFDILNLPECSIHKENLYRERVRLARHSPEQRFFFSLDRESNPELLRVRETIGDLGALHVPTRKGHVLRATDFLFRRLRTRFDRLTPSPPGTPPVPFPTPSSDGSDAASIRECSGLFRAAALTFPSGPGVPVNWTQIGQACSAFAAGELKTSVEIDPSTHETWGVTEPDSANILMFAELAFAALSLTSTSEPQGIDADMWLPLLPYLVRMQWYYWGRWPAASHPFTEYKAPMSGLDPAARLAADRAIPLDAPHALLEERIATKLGEYVSTMA